ncbi:hypothetical protein Tco_0355376 [Tanacetum coccineum]
MRLAKKVKGTVEESESFRGKLVKTMREEASCCRTSCIYQGEEDQSFSIQSLSESKWLAQNKRLNRVLVAEFVSGEQFVTEEIIEEWNRWPNIEIEEVRMKASQCEEGCFKAIEGNVKEYQIRGMELAVVWIVPSVTKDIILLIGLECGVFRFANKSVGVYSMTVWNNLRQNARISSDNNELQDVGLKWIDNKLLMDNELQDGYWDLVCEAGAVVGFSIGLYKGNVILILKQQVLMHYDDAHHG